MFPDAVVELTSESADDRFVASIRPTQSTAAESAEMSIRRNDDDGFPHLFDLNRGDDRRRGSAVDDDVGLLGADRYKRQQPEEEEGGFTHDQRP